MRIWLILFFLSVITLSSFQSCSALKERVPSSAEEKITSHFLNEIIKSSSTLDPLHGSIVVAKGDEILAESTFGLANLEFSIPHSANSRFVLASVSKQFTAGAIAQLVKKGRLSLEDPITRFFPLSKVHKDNWPAWQKIKIIDLLGHRSGLIKDIQPGTINTSQKYRLNHLTDLILKDSRLTSKTYGTYYYSNIGYTLLARIVEITSGFDFSLYLTFKLLSPIEAMETGVYHRSFIIPHLANGYYRNEDDQFQKICCVDFSTNAGSHNLYSTPRDLLKWIRDLTIEHKSVPEDFLSFARATTLGNGRHYMNGLFHEVHPSLGNHFWHDGFSGGYASRVSFFPDQEISIIILLNRVNVFTTQRQIDSLHTQIVERFRP